MQLATANRTQRPRGFDRGYATIDRDYAAIHRSRLAIFGQRLDRPTSVELDAYRAAIRRNADDTIDFDFYRSRATSLRGQTKQKHAALRFVCAGLLALGFFTAIVVSAAAPKSSPINGGAAATNISLKP